MTTVERPYSVVGTRPIRPDGVDKVTGRAVYGADVRMAGMLSGRVKRSPHAHAIIKRIDTFLATTQPLIAYYDGKGLVSRIDASQSIEAVSRDIQQVIEKAKV